MMLTTKGRYAVMAMVDLAIQPQEKPVGLASIAERQEIPLAYLEQIFAKMKRAGLVASTRGPGGGYRLGKEASALTIAAIVQAAEEEIKMTRCKSDHHGCLASKTQCLTHDLWEGLSDQISGYLSNVTLEDVCRRKVKEVLNGRWPAAAPETSGNHWPLLAGHYS